MTETLSPPIGLSIAIPTFNRSHALENTLGRIIPQLSAAVECVVLDNASTDATPDVLSSAAENCSFLRVIRHPCNIGGNANFLRCFEVARGRWIWILPDDDLPYADAVHRILGATEKHPDAGYFNFATSLLAAVNVHRDVTTTARGLTHYISSLDSFSHLLFLTAGVYRRDIMLQGMPLAARMTHTYGPYLALLLDALRRNPSLQAVQSHVSIADWRGPAQWDKEQLTRGAYHLLEIIPERDNRIRLCRLIEKDTPPFLARRNWMSDVISSAAAADRDLLARAIQRYSTIAALTGRYRNAAIASAVIDACSPLGSRWLCKLLRKAQSATKRSQAPEAVSAAKAATIAADRRM